MAKKLTHVSRVRFCISCLLMFLYVDLGAQVEFSGRLVSVTTGAPQEGYLYIRGTDLVAKSNEKGVFSILFTDSSAIPDSTEAFAWAYQFEPTVISISRGQIKAHESREIQIRRFFRHPEGYRNRTILVKGRLVDQEGGFIAGARVQSDKIHQWAVTDKTGRYQLQSEIVDSYETMDLWFSKPGFRTRVIPLGDPKRTNFSFKRTDADTLYDATVRSATVTVHVRDPLEKNVKGVSVLLGGEDIGATDLLGTTSYSWSQAPSAPVTVSCQCTKPDGGIVRDSTQVMLNNALTFVDMALDCLPWQLYVVVQDSLTLEPIANAYIKPSRGPDIFSYSDAGGAVTLSLDHPRGVIEVGCQDYRPKAGAIDMIARQDTIDVLLAPAHPYKLGLQIPARLDSTQAPPGYTYLAELGAWLLRNQVASARQTPGDFSADNVSGRLHNTDTTLTKIIFVDSLRGRKLADVQVDVLGANNYQLSNHSGESLIFFAGDEYHGTALLDGYRPKNFLVKRGTEVRVVNLSAIRKRDAFQEEIGVVRPRWSARFGITMWDLNATGGEPSGRAGDTVQEQKGDVQSIGVRTAIRYAKEIETTEGKSPKVSAGYQFRLGVEGWPNEYWRASGGFAGSLHYRNYAYILIGAKLNGLSTEFNRGAQYGGVTALVGATLHPKSFSFLDTVYDAFWFPKSITFEMEDIVGNAFKISAAPGKFIDVALIEEKFELSAIWQTKLWLVELAYTKAKPTIRVDGQQWRGINALSVSYGVTW